MSDQWGLALPDGWTMETDPKGRLIIPFEATRLLVFLYKHWEMPPQWKGHTVQCYLTEVFRLNYFAPEWVIPLVIEELKSQPRKYKPLPETVQSLVGAAVNMELAWKAVGFAHTYSPQEPSRLPLDHSDRMRKAELNKIVKQHLARKKRHKYRVILEDEDD